MIPVPKILGASLLSVVTRALARTSLRTNQCIGQVIGWLAWISHSKLRQVAEINLELCYPELSAIERKALARRSLLHTGMALTEAPWIGLRPKEQVRELIHAGEGAALFTRALQDSEGMIVATPHWGSWEVTCLVMSEQVPLTYLYRSPRNPVMEAHLLKWRANLGGTPATLDPAGIRQVLKQIKQGKVVGILPDQEPDPGGGTFAPFFSTPAYTMTLLAKLASRTGAPVLFCIAERLPAGRGWKINYLPAETGINSDDRVIAATALNITVQRCIAYCADQYMWSYKRFRLMDNGERRRYRR